MQLVSDSKVLASWQFAVGVAFLTGVPAVVAQVPVDAARLLEQKPELSPVQAPTPESDVAPLSMAIPELEQGEVGVRLKGLRLKGDDPLLEPSVMEALESLVANKDLGFVGLQAVADRVAAAARARGFPLAQAILPEQDLSDGFLLIDVRLGYLDEPPFELRDPLGVLKSELASTLLSQFLKAGAVLHSNELNEALLRLNALSGINAKASFEAGSQVGSTKVIVSLEPTDLLNIQTGLSNGGNLTTGMELLSLNVRIDNPMRHAERLQLNVTQSKGIQLINVGAAMPVGQSGGYLGVSSTQLTYKSITSDPATQGLNGDSSVHELTWNLPLLHQLSQSVSWFTAFEKKRMNDRNSTGGVVLRLSDKEVTSLSTGFNGRRSFPSATGTEMSGALTFKTGRVSLAQDTQVTNNLERDQLPGSGLFTQGRYKKIEWSFDAAQPFARNVRVNLKGRGQRALGHKNLDSSEKMSLGGVGGVRAYPSGEASGDHAHLFQLELNYKLPWRGPGGEQMALSLFRDEGWVRFYNNPTVNGREDIASNDLRISRYSLKGYGVNFNFMSVGRFFMDLTWAKKLGDNPGSVQQGMDSDGQQDRERWWLNAQWIF